MTMRILPATTQEWLSLLLFPFKVYTCLAYFALLVWYEALPRRADYTGAAGCIVIGYGLCFLALAYGGAIQRVVSPRRAWLATCAFAAADMVLFCYCCRTWLTRRLDGSSV
jgi:hypothetical protein